MNFTETLHLALNSLRSNKLRSILTTLGILIGVMTIISMQALIKGLNDSVEDELAYIGTNTFYVQKFPVIYSDASRYQNRKDITMNEAQAIEKRALLISMVAPADNQLGVTLRSGRKKTSPTVILVGSTQDWHRTNGYVVEEGRFLTRFDVMNNRAVCVLGVTVTEKLFPFQDPVGKHVLIDGSKFTVVGVFEERGALFGQDRDNLAVIPLSAFAMKYGKKRSLIIAMKARAPEILDEAMDEAIGILRVERRIPFGKKNDFEVITQDSLMDTWRNLTRLIRIAGTVICFISLLVGGIGVMNIMLVSVTERTREIGIRKAVGAKPKDIMLQFLTEAILICEFGGFIGVVLSFGIEQLLASLIQLPVAIPLWSIILGLGFVSLVGIFFGFYPADKAARLDTIRALHFE
jgi:putative ABC transport system permease protein